MGDCVMRIPLRAGRQITGYALVDAEDFEWLGQWRWRLHSDGYVYRNYRLGGKQFTVRMHRLILGLAHGDPREGDHINRDRLDNRRANLRVATAAQQRQNESPRGGASRYRGVSWCQGRWQAVVNLDGQRHYLGRFATEEEAAAVAARWRAEHMPFSEDARCAA